MPVRPKGAQGIRAISPRIILVPAGQRGRPYILGVAVLRGGSFELLQDEGIALIASAATAGRLLGPLATLVVSAAFEPFLGGRAIDYRIRFMAPDGVVIAVLTSGDRIRRAPPSTLSLSAQNWAKDAV
jgi:hypothetical protein